MWLETAHGAVEERALAQVDAVVGQIVEDIYTNREVAGDWGGHPIYAVIFESERGGVNNEVFYGYRFWLDGIAEVDPGDGAVTGFSFSTVLGIRNGLIPGDGDFEITVQELATFLGTQVGHSSAAIRRYIVVPPQPVGVDVIPIEP